MEICFLIYVPVTSNAMMRLYWFLVFATVVHSCTNIVEEQITEWWQFEQNNATQIGLYQNKGLLKFGGVTHTNVRQTNYRSFVVFTVWRFRGLLASVLDTLTAIFASMAQDCYRNYVRVF